MPPCNDEWTKIKFGKIMPRIVAKVSGSIFVGPELCRDEGYLYSAVEYTGEVMKAAFIIGFIRPWMRPYIAWLIPGIRKCKTRKNDLAKVLRPVIDARLEASKQPGYQKPDDMLQWLMDQCEKMGKQPMAERLGHFQTSASFAAIHTTSLVTHNLYGLKRPNLLRLRLTKRTGCAI